MKLEQRSIILEVRLCTYTVHEMIACKKYIWPMQTCVSGVVTTPADPAMLGARGHQEEKLFCVF